MRTSFFYLSCNEAPLLEHAIAAGLAEQPDELYVVDNGSTDGTPELCARLGIECIALSPRVTYCEAMNVGIARATGGAVALLQADCFVQPGFKAAALASLQADPLAGSVAPKLMRTTGPRPEDRTQQMDAAGMVFDRRRKNGLVGHGRPASGYTTPGEVFGADGAGAVYRAVALRECAVAGEVFDPDLERWASDADVAWRLRTLGWRSVFAPDARAYHVRTYSPSTRNTMPEASRQMQFRNRYLMMVKNDRLRDVLRDLPIIALYEILALGHVLLRERHLLAAYGQTLRLLPAARRRRAALRRRRRASRPPFGLEARQ